MFVLTLNNSAFYKSSISHQLLTGLHFTKKKNINALQFSACWADPVRYEKIIKQRGEKSHFQRHWL